MKTSFPRWQVNGNEKLIDLCTNFKACPEAIDLLTQLVCLEPSRRITLKAAMQHPFFNEYNGNSIVKQPSTSIASQNSLPKLSPMKHKSLVR